MFRLVLDTPAPKQRRKLDTEMFIRLPAATKKRLKKRADAEHRSASAEARVAIERHLKDAA